MINKIEGQEVTLEKFDKNNHNHLNVAMKFKKDKVVNMFFPEWEQVTYLSIADDTNTYYSYIINILGLPVGLCTMTFINNETVILSQGFLNEFRGKGYYKLFIQTLLNYLFTTEVKQVKSYIREKNISSIRSALKIGMALSKVPETDLLEICYEQSRNRM